MGEGEWWLYGRKATHGDGTCTAHYEGTWQPRRNGSLVEITEEMMASNLSFTAFFLSFGDQQGHERPPRYKG